MKPKWQKRRKRFAYSI